ncbi:hypothetical protein TcasGA2_TC007901 [Tribolium castaneum]|uniref:Uncharacterized protein n=1 Tax=Tribolium castaneum TaxID=7070 RepID=D2A2Y6_TRICA|nr:hypothetical protein TcasGA2_TC007901 [Tribolium castaneum]
MPPPRCNLPKTDEQTTIRNSHNTGHKLNAGFSNIRGESRKENGWGCWEMSCTPSAMRRKPHIQP